MSQTVSKQPAALIRKAWSLLDWDRPLANITTDKELEEALWQIPNRALTPNTIVNLVSPDGDTLSVGIAGPADKDNPGLAQPLACVNYTARTKQPPYLTVVGDPSLNLDNGGVVVFRFEEGTWTEVLRRNCVPVEVMVRIAQHFFHTGSLPDWIAWEEV